MSTKSPECYTTDLQARCLRVEPSAERSLLLSLNQFVFAELTGNEKEQKFRLVFATHEVVITGHVLRRIETALQRMELSGIMKLAENYHSVIGEGQPRIREIVATESQSVESQMQTWNQ